MPPTDFAGTEHKLNFPPAALAWTSPPGLGCPAGGDLSCRFE